MDLSRFVLVTDLNFGLHRHFVEDYGKMFSRVYHMSPNNRLDLRTLRGKHLIFLGVHLGSSDLVKVMNGLMDVGSLTIYGNVPFSEELLDYTQNDYYDGNVRVYVNPLKSFTYYESSIMSSVELFMKYNSGFVIDEKYLSYSSLFMKRVGVMSYDSSALNSFNDYSGGFVADSSYYEYLHPDLVGFVVGNIRYPLGGGWYLELLSYDEDYDSGSLDLGDYDLYYLFRFSDKHFKILRYVKEVK